MLSAGRYFIWFNTPIGQGAGALGRHGYGLAHAVQDDEVVAGAVHFGEVPDHLLIIAQSGLSSFAAMLAASAQYSDGSPSGRVLKRRCTQ